MTRDPRNDGFYYGGALPVPAGFGVYDDAVRLAEKLARQNQEASARQWRLDMAIRDVRHACTALERATFLAKLTDVLKATRQELGDKPQDPAPNYTFDELAKVR